MTRSGSAKRRSGWCCRCRADRVDDAVETGCGSEDVEATVIGQFWHGWSASWSLIISGTEVGRMSMKFLHDGIPMPTRKAVVTTGGVALAIPFVAEATWDC